MPKVIDVLLMMADRCHMSVSSSCPQLKKKYRVAEMLTSMISSTMTKADWGPALRSKYKKL
jgi:hypothetical protein